MASDDEPLVEELAAIAESLARREPVTDTDAQTLRDLAARFERVVAVLEGRGVLSPKDVMILKRLGAAARPRVELKVVEDKHAVASPPIDCASLIHLCHARCCSFRVILSEADVREGKLRWELHEPYVLARGRDGYCTHLRETGCECYDDRPATCRSYDCREDKRVWIDFEQKIPAPMPEHVKKPR
jgi:hypothetical protein